MLDTLGEMLFEPFAPVHFLVALPLWAGLGYVAGLVIESLANLIYLGLIVGRSVESADSIDFMEKVWRGIVGFCMGGAIGALLTHTIAKPLPPHATFGWPEAAAVLCGAGVFYAFGVGFLYAPSFREFVRDYLRERARRPRVYLPREDREALERRLRRRKDDDGRKAEDPERVRIWLPRRDRAALKGNLRQRRPGR